MVFTYICIRCNRFIKDVDKQTAQKFLRKHNKNNCLTDLITNEYLEIKLSRNYRKHPNDILKKEEL